MPQTELILRVLGCFPVQEIHRIAFVFFIEVPQLTDIFSLVRWVEDLLILFRKLEHLYQIVKFKIFILLLKFRGIAWNRILFIDFHKAADSRWIHAVFRFGKFCNCVISIMFIGFGLINPGELPANPHEALYNPA